MIVPACACAALWQQGTAIMRWRDFVDIVSLASIWELDADPTQRIDPSGRHHRAATLAPLTRVRPAAYRADFYRDFHVRRCIGVGQASA